MLIVLLVITSLFVLMVVLAKIKKTSSVYNCDPKRKNPMEGKKVVFVENPLEPANADGVCGHLEAVGETNHHSGFYEKEIKRLLDIVLSFFGLLFLSPLFLILSIWIVIDDPGPVLFTQKRIGKDKRYFKEHKNITACKYFTEKEIKVA